MDIQQAKQQIKYTMQAYFAKDEFGGYALPPQRQRPIFLLGAPGIGKTAIVEQIAQELEVGFVSYSMTHHTRQSALGLPFIAQKEYGGPCIYIDFGTATTFGVLSKKGEFLGGAICPGLKLASEALTERAAQLSKVELVKPETVIGRNTITNMQAGIVYGYVGQVDYIVRKMKAEIGGSEHIRVIATGGLSRMIASETSTIDIIDGLLTLKGLRLLYERNAR